MTLLAPREAEDRIAHAVRSRHLALVDEADRARGQVYDPYNKEWRPNRDTTPEHVIESLTKASDEQAKQLVASRQYFMDVLAEPPLANLTALTATTIEALWAAATYTPLSAYDANRPGKIYVIRAGGIMSFAATGSLTITPNVGTATGGATLGASNARTSPGTTTNAPWFLEMSLVVRTVGSSGTVIGVGTYNTQGTATLDISVTFGGTSATLDTTAASGITIGKTLSVAGSVTTQFVIWQSAN